MKTNFIRPIGMRNLKTAFAVFVCLLFYLLCGFLYGLLPDGQSIFIRGLDFLLNRSNPIFACIAAVICMQSSVENSYALSKSRLVGTAVGGLVGILMLMIASLKDHLIISYLLFSLGVVLNIYICNLIKNNTASSIACIVFLVIVLSIDSGNKAVPYAINRMIDTAVGILISVQINCHIKAPDKDE